VAGLFEGDTTTAWTPSASLACDATADTVPPPPRPKTTPKKRAKKAPHTASVAGGEYEIDYNKAPEHWDLQVTKDLVDKGLLGKRGSWARSEFQKLVDADLSGCCSYPYSLFIPFDDARVRTVNRRTIVTPTIASPDFVKKLSLSHHFCEMLKGKGGRKTCQGYSGTKIESDTPPLIESDIEKDPRVVRLLHAKQVEIEQLEAMVLVLQAKLGVANDVTS